MNAMRDHFEDTPMDMRKGVGAGPFENPYRWRPLEFEVDGQKYLNERAIATQQTGYSFVAQSREWLPAPIGGVFWFGVDDTDGSVYTPFYCKIRQNFKGTFSVALQMSILFLCKLISKLFLRRKFKIKFIFSVKCSS